MATRHTLELSDSGNRITVAPGDTVRLVLTAAPSTGAAWQVVEAPDWLPLVADSMEDEIADLPESAQPSENSEAIGYIDHVLDFEVAPETPYGALGMLRLHWRRPWEGTTYKSFALTMNVADQSE